MPDIKELSLEELKERFNAAGIRPFHAEQVFAWIYRKMAGTFRDMSDLPASLREYLSSDFSIYNSVVAHRLVSRDGTVKLLSELADGNMIESVLIPTERRMTGCISVQAGCGLRCAFCASGALGLERNLNCGEILEQVCRLQKEAGGRLTHLVFMGTGEPFNNYDNLIKAVRIINSKESFHIGARRITISTSGILPGIARLAGEGLQVELSVSLHAADNEIRSRLMPVNEIYPLSRLLAACRVYSRKTGRQVTFEYILIKGINSSLPNAVKLCKMLKGMGCKVNLIPLNPLPSMEWRPPSAAETAVFSSFLRRQGIQATVRQPRGRDIEAACGQLRLQYAQNRQVERCVKSQ
ncbi:MAG: 23S rRNA (adenine(2503)-C(2))-methyltransferase RlmN [Candidatus Omnitrophota bacterium]|jgi:23S rRNA (adenine2503-C2)-methyltransferase|nr:23S rRNA (adenine(2503)-C(2))-methyltransferase RlmN [Candidatus Omnitrophota bacterium]MDD5526032.1 23S rRNA (adenine(2503)-C(2))-methyltransferase RlmN [Candidatus Omnitrophota bacterium]